MLVINLSDEVFPGVLPEDDRVVHWEYELDIDYHKYYLHIMYKSGEFRAFLADRWDSLYTGFDILCSRKYFVKGEGYLGIQSLATLATLEIQRGGDPSREWK